MRSARSSSTERRAGGGGRPTAGRAASAAWRPAAIVACALPVAAVLAPAAAGSDRVIWQGNDQSVALAPRDVATAPLNDHPASVAPRDIERMLSALRFRYADQEADTPLIPVFNEEQIGILRAALATGLARATPSQDVTFSIIGAHRLSPGAFARRNRLTAGRVFFREGRLNLILGEIQSPYRKKNIYGRIDEDFSPREYGSRATAAKHGLVLVASHPVGLNGDPDGERDDWVAFRPSDASTPPLRGTNASAAAEAAPGSAGPDAGPLRPRTPPSAMEVDDADDLEERLRTLKRLREQELISEEAYRQKVDEILEDL